ncbi:MAG: hypothetical protein ACMZ7B_10450 [Balneola sp.]
MSKKKITFFWLMCVLLISGCSALKKVEKKFTPPEKLQEVELSNTYMKAHMGSGDVYVFNRWSYSETDSMIRGNAKYYNAYRDEVFEDSVNVFIADIELIETNVTEMSGGAAALSVVTGISLAMTTFCLLNTKACFGSCPTFYTDINDTLSVLEAEGFSASVLPSLEATDIDALKQVSIKDSRLELRLTNEALETHNIKYSNLLYFPHGDDKQVLATGYSEFRYASNEKIEITITSETGNVTDLINELDDSYYYSLADSNDLAVKEFLKIEVPASTDPDKQYGIVISARQSLLSTFLFYQALSYLGENATYVLSEVERSEGGFSERVESMNRILGDIELYTNGEKNLIGSFKETGPLATDVQVIPIPQGADLNNLQLKLNRGHWRIDQIQLVELFDEVKPIRIQPEVYSTSKEYDELATQTLNNPSKYFTTLPGDEYYLSFTLPDSSSEGSFYLENRGYYLEWMRDEWVKEQDMTKAFEMFLRPRKMLRELAPVYKEMEPEMEKIFWNSQFVSHEN